MALAQEFYPLLGSFEALTKLAKTDMAESFLGRELGTEAFARLELIRARFACDPAFVEVLRADLAPVLRLRHRNILSVERLDPVEELQLLVTEHLNGVTLRELIDRLRETARPTEPSIAAYLIAEVCRGLEHAHAQEPTILHGELYPSAIHLSWDGKVKLGGFGTSAAAERVRRADNELPLRTYAYLPPERLEGEPADARGDVYSVGVALYELLTQRNPFISQTASDTTQRVSQLIPPAPSTFIEEAAPLDEICARALAKDPTERYQTAQEMGNALAAALMGELRSSARRGSRDIALGSLLLLLWPQTAGKPPSFGRPDDVEVTALLEEVSDPMGETLHGDSNLLALDSHTVAEIPDFSHTEERTQISEAPAFLRAPGEGDPEEAPMPSVIDPDEAEDARDDDAKDDDHEDPSPSLSGPPATSLADPSEVQHLKALTKKAPSDQAGDDSAHVSPFARPEDAPAPSLPEQVGAWSVPPAIDVNLANKLWEELSPAAGDAGNDAPTVVPGADSAIEAGAVTELVPKSGAPSGSDLGSEDATAPATAAGSKPSAPTKPTTGSPGGRPRFATGLGQALSRDPRPLSSDLDPAPQAPAQARRPTTWDLSRRGASGTFQQRSSPEPAQPSTPPKAPIPASAAAAMGQRLPSGLFPPTPAAQPASALNPAEGLGSQDLRPDERPNPHLSVLPDFVGQPQSIPHPPQRPRGRWLKLGLITFSLAAVAAAATIFFLEQTSTPQASLQVYSEPHGASVIVGGVQRGQTPLSFPVALDEQMQVSVHLPGYIPEQRKLQISGLKNTLKVRLKPSTGSLQITAHPKGARIFVDGVHQGDDLVNLDSLPLDRPMLLRITLNGHAATERQLRLDASQPKLTLEETLRPLRPGERQTVRVNLRAPLGRTLEIYRGAERLGKTPLEVTLEVGENTLRVVSIAEGLDRQLKVQAPAEEGATIHLAL